MNANQSLKDRRDRSSPLMIEAKPGEYDINMHPNDVYDGI